MIKGSIQEEDITIINIYAPNIGPLQYVRQMLTSMKEEINSNTIIVGDFNTPLTTMDRSTKQKINNETQSLNDTMDQLDLIDIYRTSLFISWLWSLPTVILEPPKIKSVTVSIVSTSICHEVMVLDAMILVFLMLSFKPAFSLSSFTFIKRFFSSSLLSTIRVMLSPYLRLLIFLPSILISACAISSLVIGKEFHVIKGFHFRIYQYRDLWYILQKQHRMK